MAGADLVLSSVTKRFGTFTAVDDLNLTVPRGSFFALIGPSGCGKTTTLRMVAGLEEPTAGEIRLADQDITRLRPYKRPVNTVFQSYALFPHLSIFENVAFGLRRRRVGDVKKQVGEMLELVELQEYAGRKPAQLSGGQQQRVALARALINQPQVLLLDEPLGALDLKLREQMQSELKALQRRLGITFLFITHDQHEALSMSDRIGVFNAGRLEQVGTPQQVYNTPATRFVAQFVGAANVLDDPVARTLTGHGSAMLRPERIRIGAAQGARATGTVREVQYFGAFTRVRVELDGCTLQADLPETPQSTPPVVGAGVHLHWDAEAVHPLGASARA